VLLQVRDLRAQGLHTETINEQLAGLTFAVIESDEQSPPADTEIAPTSTAPDGLQQAPVVLVALEAMQRQLDAVRIIASEGKQARRDNVIVFGFGFMTAALMFLLLIVLSWLYGG